MPARTCALEAWRATVRALRPADRRLLTRMLERGLNAPVTTSAGRLFDAVAALLDLHQQVSFEGQAAMALEFVADAGVEEAYPFPMITPTDDRRPTTGDRRPASATEIETAVGDHPSAAPRAAHPDGG